MSKINCESCDNLRNHAPEFVQNGVTDNICTSLQNNTGLNPSLSVLHENAEDLHDVNDCTIGRMAQEIDAYDVCNWKEYMKKLVPNIYEHNKAQNCSDAGQWTKIMEMEGKSDLLCESIDNILSLVRGAQPKTHIGTWQTSFLNKITIYLAPDGTTVSDKTIYHSAFQADIVHGAGCDESKRLGRYQLYTHWDNDPYPKYYYWNVTTALSNGEVIGTIPRSAVPETDMPLARWKNLLRAGNLWEWGTIHDDTLMYVRTKGYTIIDGVAFNTEYSSYGEDTMVLLAGPFIGDSRTGAFSASKTNLLSSYDA